VVRFHVADELDGIDVILLVSHSQFVSPDRHRECGVLDCRRGPVRTPLSGVLEAAHDVDHDLLQVPVGSAQ
jgi:hypothetical protein